MLSSDAVLEVPVTTSAAAGLASRRATDQDGARSPNEALVDRARHRRSEARARLARISGVRREAAAVLGRLLTDREHSERRLAERGVRDAIKMATGRSALERAIDATREMVVHLDALIRALRDELSAAEEVGDFRAP